MGLVWWCQAGAALAAQKVLVVGAGDCREPTLTTNIKQFQDEARPLLKGQLFEPDIVLEIVRPRPSRSLADLQRQVDSARTLLYGGQNERGLELVKQALAELDKASPQVAPWPVTAAALLVQSQLYKNLGKTKEMTEAYRRLLRIDPAFTLDPDAYPPSTLQAFEGVRKELARARKATLQVQSTPPGAGVYVDGRELGKTPAKLELAPGSYRVSLKAGDQVSFSRRVDLKKEADLQVDMGFEGAVATQPPLCVSSNEDDEVLKLGASVAADQVIVVRSVGGAGNPPYLTAVLYDASARRERNGGARPDALAQLATFIVTGQPGPGVSLTGTPPPVTPPQGPKPPVGPVTTGGTPTGGTTTGGTSTGGTSTGGTTGGTSTGSTGGATTGGTAPPGGLQVTDADSLPPPPPPPPVAATGTSGARIAGYVLLGTGVAVAAGGLIAYLSGANDRSSLAALTRADGRLYEVMTPNHTQAIALMPRVDANRALSFGLLGAGAGLVAAGVLAVVLFPAESAPQVAVLPTPDGGGVAFVTGRF